MEISITSAIASISCDVLRYFARTLDRDEKEVTQRTLTFSGELFREDGSRFLNDMVQSLAVRHVAHHSHHPVESMQ